MHGGKGEGRGEKKNWFATTTMGSTVSGGLRLLGSSTGGGRVASNNTRVSGGKSDLMKSS